MSENSAEFAAEHHNKRKKDISGGRKKMYKEMYAYKCRECLFWHLTSQKQKIAIHKRPVTIKRLNIIRQFKNQLKRLIKQKTNLLSTTSSAENSINH